jgi:tetratricopeptide (TPR) repeat protein
MKGRIQIAVALLALVMPWRAVSAHQAEDQREVQGRALFAKGDYQAALDLYATLFAEKSDPIYLRNIGRCYQKLEQPQKAIDAFEEYLRRKHVKQAERTEVEGFIAEMQELEKRKAATTPPSVEPIHAPPPSAAESAPIAPPPSPGAS